MLKDTSWALLFCAAGLAACGDDGGPTGSNDPDLTRADVAGQYEMTVLTFDPQGSGLAEEDLLARVDFAHVPELIVAANEDSLQLVFRIEGSLLRIVPGTYDLGDDGITAELDNATVPGELLLPQDIAYLFDEEGGTLHFSGTIQADTARLFELVPEWSGEPVTDPLPGTLTVTFTRD